MPENVSDHFGTLCIKGRNIFNIDLLDNRRKQWANLGKN